MLSMQSNQNIYKSSKSGKQYQEIQTIKQGSIYKVKDQKEQVYILKKQSALRKQEKMFFDLILLKQLKMIKIFEYFEVNNYFCIVSEYCNGGNLQQELQRKIKFNEQEATKIILDICKQLEILHSYEIIYQDLKPSNIVIEKNKDQKIKYKLCDFESILLVEYSNQQEEELQFKQKTTNYIAPEELNQANENTKQIDIWNLGILYYELITGNKFFKGTQKKEILKQIDNYSKNYEEQKAQILQNIEMDKKLKYILEQTLHPNPKYRPSLQQVLIIFMKQKIKYLKTSFLDYTINASRVLDQEIDDNLILSQQSLGLEKYENEKKKNQDLLGEHQMLMKENKMQKDNLEQQIKDLIEQVQSQHNQYQELQNTYSRISMNQSQIITSTYQSQIILNHELQQQQSDINMELLTFEDGLNKQSQFELQKTECVIPIEQNEVKISKDSNFEDELQVKSIQYRDIQENNSQQNNSIQQRQKVFSGFSSNLLLNISYSSQDIIKKSQSQFVENRPIALLISQSQIASSFLIKSLFPNDSIQIWKKNFQQQLGIFVVLADYFNFEEIDERDQQIKSYQLLFQQNPHKTIAIWVVVEQKKICFMHEELKSILKYINLLQIPISVVVTDFVSEQDQLSIITRFKYLKLKTIIFLNQTTIREQMIDQLRNTLPAKNPEQHYPLNLIGTVFEDDNS